MTLSDLEMRDARGHFFQTDFRNYVHNVNIGGRAQSQGVNHAAAFAQMRRAFCLRQLSFL